MAVDFVDLCPRGAGIPVRPVDSRVNTPARQVSSYRRTATARPARCGQRNLLAVRRFLALDLQLII